MSFAALALLLAIMGVYAVMSYLTVQRTGEFAIRAALGALARRHSAARAARSGEACAPSASSPELALAVAASRVLANLLFGLKSTDTLTYADRRRDRGAGGAAGRGAAGAAGVARRSAGGATERITWFSEPSENRFYIQLPIPEFPDRRSFAEPSASPNWDRDLSSKLQTAMKAVAARMP